MRGFAQLVRAALACTAQPRRALLAAGKVISTVQPAEAAAIEAVAALAEAEEASFGGAAQLRGAAAAVDSETVAQLRASRELLEMVRSRRDRAEIAPGSHRDRRRSRRSPPRHSTPSDIRWWSRRACGAASG